MELQDLFEDMRFADKAGVEWFVVEKITKPFPILSLRRAGSQETKLVYVHPSHGPCLLELGKISTIEPVPALRGPLRVVELLLVN
jgi:hypothetical protein